MPIDPNPADLLALSARICCAGIAIKSLELAVHWRELRDHHLLGWQGPGTSSNGIRRVLQRSQGYPLCLLILLWRAGASLACVALPYPSTPAAWLLASLFVTQMYYHRRFFDVFSNSDNMFLISLAAVLIGAWPGSSLRLRMAALFFLAIQSLLAYVNTGQDKLTTSRWRNGIQLTRIFLDSSHKFPPLGTFLMRYPKVSVLASWTVILLELLFPLCIVLPSPGFWMFIAAGFLFHAGVAFTMGLTGFLWAFASTYPAIYYVHVRLSAILYG